MKGVPIKFRGVNIVEHTTLKKGETICGKVLMQYANGKVWLGNETGTYVDPDSVVQLVGYDSEGNEVYEGDIVDGFFGDCSVPSYNFQAALLNNFFVDKRMKDIKHIVRRNENVEV